MGADLRSPTSLLAVKTVRKIRQSDQVETIRLHHHSGPNGDPEDLLDLCWPFRIVRFKRFSYIPNQFNKVTEISNVIADKSTGKHYFDGCRNKIITSLKILTLVIIKHIVVK